MTTENKTDREATCRRVASLIALTLSPVAGESQAARTKVGQLVAQYSLEAQEIRPHCQKHVVPVLEKFYSSLHGSSASSRAQGVLHSFSVTGWNATSTLGLADQIRRFNQAAERIRGAEQDESWRQKAHDYDVMSDIIYRYSLTEDEILAAIRQNADDISLAVQDEIRRRDSSGRYKQVTLRNIDAEMLDRRQAFQSSIDPIVRQALFSIDAGSYEVAVARLQHVVSSKEKLEQSIAPLSAERLARISLYDKYCMKLYKY